MAKAATSPAYLMYPGDILASGRVAALKPLEELWYRRALDLGWEHHGMPSDPVEFAGWVGRGCTVAGAEKIIAKFYKPKQRDASKVVNPRQEKERKAFITRTKNKSEVGKNAAKARWEKVNAEKTELELQNETSKNEVSVSVSKNDTSAYANALPKDAIPIPIPIPIPISKIDLKRLIHACVREHPRVDPKIVEIGIYYTLLQRNGDRSPINSLAYFAPQIKRVEKEFKTGDARAGVTPERMMQSIDHVRDMNRWKLFPDERPTAG